MDVTIPGKPVEMGHQHPMNQRAATRSRRSSSAWAIRSSTGPEVELADYNFTKLNIAEDHPSRDRSDTFYFDDDDSVLLRTQTSPMQIRAMEQQKPPIRMLAPGRVLPQGRGRRHALPDVPSDRGPRRRQGHHDGRPEGHAGDAHQAPCTARTPSSASARTTSRSPSRAARSTCSASSARHGETAAAPTCKGEGWIELLGAGMVHPKVLEGCGIDPEIYSGFAFGIGLERMAMRRFKHQRHAPDL